MAERDYAETLDSIGGLLEDLGDEFIDEVDGSIVQIGDPDQESKAFWYNRDQINYIVAAIPDVRFFQITIPSSLVGSISNYMDEEMVEEFSDPNDTEDESAVPPSINWLNSVDDDVMNEIQFHLRERISSPEVKSELRFEHDTMVGFTVDRKIFPYEDDFSIRDLERSVQAAYSVSSVGRIFLSEVFDLSPDTMEKPSIDRFA